MKTVRKYSIFIDNEYMVLTVHQLLSNRSLGKIDPVFYFTISAEPDLRDVAGKQSLGFLSYKRRSDEEDRVAQIGLQCQTDLMINQLFQ
ncbi:hypothetical protein [Aggregatibacter actinomycetemcomitans]|uniref:hypothetical protein n=1 Tax=Aggregatibacter actinomycetemcomitans TaxID=714 RepID=UPI00197B39EA|nr:hypothetical protein [Aggregatibacter actinomycetemcomitans]MBN6079789.1 hypothetical protein [Aggregatibacter actinomycetemcomitans]